MGKTPLCIPGSWSGDNGLRHLGVGLQGDLPLIVSPLTISPTNSTTPPPMHVTKVILGKEIFCSVDGINKPVCPSSTSLSLGPLITGSGRGFGASPSCIRVRGGQVARAAIQGTIVHIHTEGQF